MGQSMYNQGPLDLLLQAISAVSRTSFSIRPFDGIGFQVHYTIRKREPCESNEIANWETVCDTHNFIQYVLRSDCWIRWKMGLNRYVYLSFKPHHFCFYYSLHQIGLQIILISLTIAFKIQSLFSKYIAIFTPKLFHYNNSLSAEKQKGKMCCYIMEPQFFFCAVFK